MIQFIPMSRDSHQSISNSEGSSPYTNCASSYNILCTAYTAKPPDVDCPKVQKFDQDQAWQQKQLGIKKLMVICHQLKSREENSTLELG